MHFLIGMLNPFARAYGTSRFAKRASILERRGALTFVLPALALGVLLAGMAPAAEIVMGPYLQNPATNAMTVIWWTDFSTAGQVSRVEYGAGLSSEPLAKPPATLRLTACVAGRFVS